VQPYVKSKTLAERAASMPVRRPASSGERIASAPNAPST